MKARRTLNLNLISHLFNQTGRHDLSVFLAIPEYCEFYWMLAFAGYYTVKHRLEASYEG
jgi:hypothetical protein